MVDEFKDGEWKEAELIKFEYGLLWKIIRNIKQFFKIKKK